MNKKTILLVEDDEDMLYNNEALLKMRGYRTLATETLAGAAALLEQENPDLILLDVNMPDGSGFDFITEIHKTSDIPVIFLTCRTDKADEIDGLTRGGCDYITKPFDIGVLLTRIEKQLQKARPPKMITRGPLTLDLIASRATLYGEDLSLAGKEFALLSLLVRHEGETLTKEYLYEAAWSQPMAGDSNAVWVQLSRLKSKLEAGSGGKISIENYRNEGYALEIE